MSVVVLKQFFERYLQWGVRSLVLLEIRAESFKGTKRKREVVARVRRAAKVYKGFGGSYEPSQLGNRLQVIEH